MLSLGSSIAVALQGHMVPGALQRSRELRHGQGQSCAASEEPAQTPSLGRQGPWWGQAFAGLNPAPRSGSQSYAMLASSSPGPQGCQGDE